MPAGNPYTRPANRPEREAMTRQSARKAAKDNIESRILENTSKGRTVDEFLLDDSRLRRMKSVIDEAGSEDRKVLSGMKEKESRRKENRYNFKNGGCVIAGRGGKFKGSF